MGNITIQGDLTGDVPGGEVGGASNLTTVGAIPYVSAAGILNQDPTALFWDAANDRLGVGTNAPGVQLHVRGGASGTAIPLVSVTPSRIVVENSAESSISILSPSASGSFLNFGSPSDGRASGIGRAPNSSSLFFYVGDLTERMRIATTGNLLIGTTTDGNFRLDVATSGSAGTMRVYDATATTGTTRMVVRAGAGQSTSRPFEYQNSSGVFLSGLRADGSFEASSFFGALVDAADRFAIGASTSFNNSYLVQWSSTGAYNGAKDLSLSRASAGVLQVGDGGSNANGVVSLTRSQHAGVLVAALPAAAAGNAGSIQYVTDANATTIGSTVAGGGANKVMVWSDGAAWKIFAS